MGPVAVSRWVSYKACRSSRYNETAGRSRERGERRMTLSLHSSRPQVAASWTMRRQQLSAVKATRDVSKTATTSGLELMYLGCNMWRSGWGQMPSADVWGGGGGGGGRPARNWPCGAKPPDRGAWYVADIDIDGARGPEREKTNMYKPERPGCGRPGAPVNGLQSRLGERNAKLILMGLMRSRHRTLRGRQIPEI